MTFIGASFRTITWDTILSLSLRVRGGRGVASRFHVDVVATAARLRHDGDANVEAEGFLERKVGQDERSLTVNGFVRT